MTGSNGSGVAAFRAAPAAVFATGKLFETWCDWPWYYCGSDYDHWQRLHALLPGPRLATGHELSQIAAEIMPHYLAYTARQLQCRQNPAWWHTALAGRNITDDDHLFLKLCHLEFVARHQHERVLIICERPELYATLCRIWPNAGVADSVEAEGRSPHWRRARLAGEFLARYLPACGAEIPEPASEPRPALVSWYDRRAFTDGEYRDLYFGDFTGYADRDRTCVYLMRHIDANARRECRQKLQRIAPGRVSELPYAARRLDVLMALTDVRRAECMADPEANFIGRDISRLLEYEKQRDLQTSTHAEYALFARAVRAIAGSGVTLNRVIYPFENHPWERVMCRVLRECFPGIVLIGCVHAVPVTIMPSILSHCDEWDAAPLPDYLFTPGPGIAAQLASHYPPGMVRTGCANRFQHLHAAQLRPYAPLPRRPVIALCLSVFGALNRELLHKARIAFTEESASEILVREHPTMQGLTNGTWPAHMRVSREPLSALLARSDIVITAASGLAFEAIASGVPVIEFRSELQYEQSVTGYTPGMCLTARTASELRDCLMELRGGGEAAWRQHTAHCRNALQHYFSHDKACYKDMCTMTARRDKQ